jgi:hypothetical protein
MQQSPHELVREDVALDGKLIVDTNDLPVERGDSLVYSLQALIMWHSTPKTTNVAVGNCACDANDHLLEGSPSLTQQKTK